LVFFTLATVLKCKDLSMTSSAFLAINYIADLVEGGDRIIVISENKSIRKILKRFGFYDSGWKSADGCKILTCYIPRPWEDSPMIEGKNKEFADLMSRYRPTLPKR